jgi:hypothetical protein
MSGERFLDKASLEHTGFRLAAPRDIRRRDRPAPSSAPATEKLLAIGSTIVSSADFPSPTFVPMIN